MSDETLKKARETLAELSLWRQDHLAIEAAFALLETQNARVKELEADNGRTYQAYVNGAQRANVDLRKRIAELEGALDARGIHDDDCPAAEDPDFDCCCELQVLGGSMGDYASKLAKCKHCGGTGRRLQQFEGMSAYVQCYGCSGPAKMSNAHAAFDCNCPFNESTQEVLHLLDCEGARATVVAAAKPEKSECSWPPCDQHGCCNEHYDPAAKPVPRTECMPGAPRPPKGGTGVIAAPGIDWSACGGPRAPVTHIDVDSLRKRIAELETTTAAQLAALRGPECKDAECPDHDGEHPYHQNVAVKAHERAQAQMRGQIAAAQAEVKRVGEHYQTAKTESLETRHSLSLANERAEKAEAYVAKLRLDVSGHIGTIHEQYDHIVKLQAELDEANRAVQQKDRARDSLHKALEDCGTELAEANARAEKAEQAVRNWADDMRKLHAELAAAVKAKADLLAQGYGHDDRSRDVEKMAAERDVKSAALLIGMALLREGEEPYAVDDYEDRIASFLTLLDRINP